MLAVDLDRYTSRFWSFIRRKDSISYMVIIGKSANMQMLDISIIKQAAR